jgi:type I restriction enzyme M protein
VGANTGQTALVYNPPEKLTANCKLGIARCKEKTISPAYLHIYLASNYGQFQVRRNIRGGGQTGLILPDFKDLIIIRFSKNFEKAITDISLQAHKYIVDSQNIYKTAEALLLSELGLKDWKPTEETESVKSFSESYGQSGRLDAEYYQPKYDELLNHISKYPTKKLNTIVNIKKSIEPGSDAYLDNGIPFIRVANLSKYGLTEPEIHLDRKFYELMDLKPKKDTILLSKDGSVGIAYKLEKDLDAITSGAILHLTIKDEDFLPDYLTLVLNSIIVWFQAERDAGGSIIQHWKPSEIEEVIIPKIDKTIQQNITDKIQQSFALKAQSRLLLDLAKRGVEMAIERGEDEAREWMEKKNIVHGKSFTID